MDLCRQEHRGLRNGSDDDKPETRERGVVGERDEKERRGELDPFRRWKTILGLTEDVEITVRVPSFSVGSLVRTESDVDPSAPRGTRSRDTDSTRVCSMFGPPP